MQSTKSNDGFTASELIVVILILAILAGVLVPRVTDRLAAARDAQRLSDVRRLRDAIDQYFLDHGAYPPPAISGDERDYDSSHGGDFIPELLRTGALREPVVDPLGDALHAYGYNLYEEGTCGCAGKGKFYVLGITRFETPEFAAAHPGYFKCAQKDWNADFEYVTGGGASEREPASALSRK
ncbi:MAG TPA: prepilin-type N-terminal cleavage/methylation domain-containing protein [Planctomycetota bacterium]|nr:prepilin-type N-terminal cleavage/methylation domain-containing protein [Planctomycetota bacterium]